MPRTAAVEFSPRGRMFHVDAGELDLHVGDRVLFPTESGPEVATVVWPPQWTDADGLPRLVGMADAAALERDERLRADKARCQRVAEALIADHGLPMKVVGVDLDDRDPETGRTVAFYFSAPGRVDFRALIPELARGVDARIDLRQVAAREEAKLVGDVDHCGLPLCCTTFIEAFEPVSMRMAKVQDLGSNPLNLQGACGRLICCLAYEAGQYEEFDRVAPAAGERVDTPQGRGRVVGRSLPLASVQVRLPGGAVTSCAVGGCGPRNDA